MSWRKKLTHNWMEFCKSCGRKHRVMLKPCPSCNGGGGYTPQPVSEKVYETCHADYDCDGCMAYREHTNPF